ncbi:Transient receptor potential cation channel subfamily A member 1 [Acipenser ruthenus]|uniref:Transient receptor potential cation channel subfamily A member 1 n=1 Tax=Acipenser ruthenus TaxID=7906 RepID=A0A444U1M2_ACIRT|nr:Transient receptor potential cation channel subfamily A member 1 [Acipenser ruthenus]
MSLLNEKKKRSSFYECAVNEDDSADIFQVVSDGHIAKQIPLIKMKPDCLMSVDSSNSSPLHYAAGGGRIQLIQAIINTTDSEGLNVTDNKGNTPLHLAVKNKQSESCRTLLELGADPNILNANLMSPLHMAINLRHNEIVEVLLSHSSVDMNLEGDLGNTPVMLACSIDNHEALNLLAREEMGYQIERHINCVDKSGSSPLHLAVHGGNIEVIQLCIANGAKIDLQQGANIDSLDCESHSPLLLATTCGAWRTVELLVRKGANVKLKDSCGCNFLHLAVQQPKGLKNISEKILQDVKELLNDEDNEGCIPLHYACRLGIQESVTNMLGLKLLETMRDSKLLNEGDENGMTPLHLASQNGHIKVVELLLRKGALFLCDYKGRTCLHYAAVEGYTQTMKILLEKNIKLIDKADEDGNTALHLAAREGHVSSVSLLLSKGAEISLNKSEATFFHEAIHQGRNEVACVVIESERCHEAITTYKSGSTKIAPVLEMIEFLPESFKLLLDRSLKESEDDVNSQDYSIEYNFRYLQCPLTYTKLSKEDTVFKYQPLASLNAMVKFNRVELLTHPVSKKYLEMKWLAYGLKAHVLNLAIYSLGLVPLTILIVNLRPEISVNRMAENGTEVREEHWPWQCGAITVFHSWVNFLFYMQRFERFGIYVVMFGEILRTLFCIILLFFFLNLAFALAFYALMLEQIGLAVGDIAEVQRNACLKRIAMQIDLHTNLEEKLPYWFMKRVDQVKVTVYPNRACGSKFPAFWNWNGKPESRTRLNTGHCQSTPLEFEVQTQKYRLKDISKVLEKQHNLLKLIIQKMEIVSEADEQDDTELFQYGNAKRQQLLHNKSKWNSLVKAVHDKKHIIK